MDEDLVERLEKRASRWDRVMEFRYLALAAAFLAGFALGLLRLALG